MRLVLILFLFTFLFPQRYFIKNYTKREGLPHVQIFDIKQDQNDFLWLATGSGLARFDGKNFKVYNLKNGLPAGEVYGISVDKKNRLWVSGIRGIAYLDANPLKSDSIHILDNSKNEFNVFSILKYRNKILLGTRLRGLQIFENGQFKQHPISHAYDGVTLTHLTEFNHEIWGVFSEKTIFRLDSNLQLIEKFNSSEFKDVTSMRIESDQRIYFSTGNKIKLLNPQTKKVTTLFDLKGTNRPSNIYDFQLKENRFYVTTNVGLYVLDENEKLFLNKDNGLSSNVTSSIFIDKQANVWVGSDSFGLNVIFSLDIKNYTESNGLANNAINAIIRDDNQLLLGTDEGISSLNLKTNKIKRDQRFNDFNNTIIWTMYKDSKKRIWLGTESKIYIWDKGNVIKVKYPTDMICMEFFEDKDGSIFALTTNGFHVFQNGNWSTFPHLNDLGERIFWTVKNWGADYLIGSQSGLIKFNKEKEEISWLSDRYRNVYSIAIIDSNSFYFGADDGLFLYKDKKIEQIKKIGLRAFSVISTVKLTADTSLWVAHEDGIDLIKNSRVINSFNIKNGLVSNEVTTDNAYYNVGNLHYFGLFEGLAVLKEKMQSSQLKPKVVIESVRYVYRNRKSDERVEIGHIFESDLSEIEFNFVSPWFNTIKRLQFKYILEGNDKIWSHTEKVNSLRYTNLKAGDYTFKIKAISTDGLESDIQTFSFSIKQTLWLKWWFILLLIVVFGAVIVLSVRSYIVRVRKRNVELERRVRRRTHELRIAKEYNEQIVEFAAIVIISVDEEGTVLSWNKQGEFTFGYSKKEMLGRNVSLLDLVNDPMPFSLFIKQINEERFISQRELRKQRANGSKADLAVSASLLLDIQGNKTGYTLIIEDISNVKKLRLQSAHQQKLMGGIEAMNQLLGTMSHHINNSVASILSMVQLYQDTGQFEEKVIEFTKDHTNRIGAVIESLKLLVENLNLKTKSYAGGEQQVFDIEEDLKKFNERLEILSSLEKAFNEKTRAKSAHKKT